MPQSILINSFEANSRSSFMIFIVGSKVFLKQKYAQRLLTRKHKHLYWNTILMPPYTTCNAVAHVYAVQPIAEFHQHARLVHLFSIQSEYLSSTDKELSRDEND